jgi:starch phosphorylase
MAINGSFFNTHRMLAQYFWNAYFPSTVAGAPSGMQPKGEFSLSTPLVEPVLV